MRFKALLSHWKLKGNIKHDSCISRYKLLGSDAQHAIHAMTVGNLVARADVIYKFESLNGVDSKFALIYADVSINGNTGLPGSLSTWRVFIKNAKISNLVSYIT